MFIDSEKCTCSIVNPTDGSAPPKTFTFDGVYGPDSNTEQIYNDIAYPFVEVSNIYKYYTMWYMVNGTMSCGFPQLFLRYYGDSDVTAEGWGQGGQLSPDLFFGGQIYHFPPPSQTCLPF